ncbi:hypothetical protein NDU88_003755 [Pleurodeles waltl]|uniref:Uncharacterized protein n=1 Tax=Pleurodeles waltl TaxID=8319 RepID=A0AAV7QE46_PLEWA|nr:hypothetical protein NDU88_003755 [Pleurodeles waltl]
MLYSRFASSVLVLPSATPEERSERGRKDKTVAARMPPRYAFGDRDTLMKRIKLIVFLSTWFSLAYFTLFCRSEYRAASV